MADGHTTGEIQDAVTLAKLGEKLDYLATMLEDYDRKQEAQRAKTEQLSLQCAACPPKLQAMQGQIDDLKKHSDTWSLLNSLGAIGAAIAGILVKGP